MRIWTVFFGFVAVIFVSTPALRGDQNWDGDNSFGNFTFDNNWYGNTQPSWGFSNGSLNFNFRNAGASTLFYNHSFWVSTNDIFWRDTFNGGVTWDGTGNGIDFNQRLENQSSFTQTIGSSMNFSGAKNGATKIELNPVNGNLTINGSIFNDNSRGYEVWGNNGKTLTIGSTLGVGHTSAIVSFTLQQNSTVIISAAQNYGGSTTINAGTLQIGNAGSTGSLGTGSVTNDAALIFNRNNSMTVSNSISGTGSVTQLGSGTTTLTASSSYSGGTFINAGTLELAHAMNTLSNTGSVTVNGGTLAIGANSDTVGTVTLQNGSITGSTGVLTGSAYNVENGLISANLGGTAALTKSSGGTVTLSGANTYSGTTAINNGTLVLNGSLSNLSAVTVAIGATLTGDGIAAGQVTVNGTIAPGDNAIDSLATGALNLNSDSTFKYELDTLSLAGDLLNVNGDLAINNANISFDELLSGTLGVGSKLTLLSYSGTWNLGTFNGYGNNSLFTIGTNVWRIKYADTSAGINGGMYGKFVTITAVPEPTSIAMVGVVAVAGGVHWIRRRRKKMDTSK
jgi:autotransporter-associated beta strand protein